MDKRIRIIIVDDELLLRRGIRYLCDWQAEGFEIVGEAADGLEGLELARSLHPDIVITDIRMARMDGLDFTAQLQEEFPETGVLVLSSYDDFQYVKTAFKNGAADYFLKPDLDAAHLLEAMRKLVPDSGAAVRGSTAPQALLRLLNQEGEDRESCLARLAQAGFVPLPDLPFFLATAQLQPKSPQAREQFLQGLDALLAAEKTVERYIVAMDAEQTLWFLLQSAAPREKLGERLESLAEKCVRTPELRFGLAGPIPDPAGLAQGGKSAARCWEFSFYYPGKRVVLPEMAGSVQPDVPQEEIARELDLLRFGQAGALLRDYIRRSAKEAGKEPYLLKKSVESQIYAAVYAAGRVGPDTRELGQMKIRFFRRVDCSENWQQLEQAVAEIFGAIAEAAGRELDSRSRDALAPVHEYVKCHCYEELHLSDVAEAVHMNYSYLSTLFRQIQNERFTDYLSRIRMERAKELMRTESLSISEIGGMVGIGDPGYFSKVFRKFEGMSPREYQRIYRPR